MKRILDFMLNTTAIFVLIAVVASMAGFFGIQALGSPAAPVAAPSCQGTCVMLTEAGMKPNTLALKVGDFVQFNTADDKKHNISLGKGADQGLGDHHSQAAGHQAHSVPHHHSGDYTSGDFGAGEAWRVQFKQPGTYRLHDHYNPQLEILIVVYDPTKPATLR